jgi:uncharacterized protein with NAD-binding domain and iron-sulfur cluster
VKRPKVAILGGGMAGVTTAWRLSEAGWQDRFESITIYQRGHRLGGKGASHRGAHGRVEEHGLHIWLGYYDNAFRLLRECYAELDRPTTDPSAPIRTWEEAMIPSTTLGLEDRHLGEWRHWLGRFSPNDRTPGDPDRTSGPSSLMELTRQGLRLILDFVDSMPTIGDLPTATLSTTAEPPAVVDPVVKSLQVSLIALLLDALLQLESAAVDTDAAVGALDRALEALRDNLQAVVEADPDLRRMWHLITLMAATTRGILADRLASHPEGLRAVNDEDFLDWIGRHGADPGVADFAFMRGLYDLVFAPVDETRTTLGVGAGTAINVTTKMFFQFHGSIFWKMAAGMGDTVFAPIYQVLRARGVDVEFFHRVDELCLSADGTSIESIRLGRQVALAPGRDRYDPLVRINDLWCFPAEPRLDQLDAPADLVDHDLESHWCSWPDAEERVLQRGTDFDVAVLAMPVDMARIVAPQLIAAKPEWQAMVDNVVTTATLALQVWLRPDEATLGWAHPGVTVSAYEQPLSTWASMPQLIDVEDWPADDRPGTIAYFCGAFRAPWPPDREPAAYVAHHEAYVAETAQRFVEDHLPHLLPGTAGPGGFRWDLLCNNPTGAHGAAAMAGQFTKANLDPSDRYVLCVPGSDKLRLRSDESGCDNLFLAGDWTDNGINAGCIEAAVLSGLQAANAIVGRPRLHRITGGYF